jgi:hypothetical protein
MDWLRSAILAAQMKTHQFAEPDALPEPPEGHEERREPEQEVTSESLSTGRSRSDTTKPSTLIVGGVSASFLQCLDANIQLIGHDSRSPMDPSFYITLREGSPSSFKRRRYDYFTLGKARQIVGTRILIRFHGVGLGAHILVPSTVPLSAIGPPPHPPPTGPPHSRPRLQLVAASPAAPYQSVSHDVISSEPHQLVEVSYSRDTAYATYEVLYSDPKFAHEATINVYVAYFSNLGQNLPALGSTTFTTVFIPDIKSKPVETAPRAAFNINSCCSALLFPFVSNQGELDTRIVVANTSLDPFGTAPERGTVKLYFFSSEETEGRVVQPITTESVPAGRQLDFSLSRGGNFGTPAMPGFQGYIIAYAHFRRTHGFAFITSPGAQSASYAAVHINSRSGYPDPGP